MQLYRQNIGLRYTHAFLNYNKKEKSPTTSNSLNKFIQMAVFV